MADSKVDPMVVAEAGSKVAEVFAPMEVAEVVAARADPKAEAVAKVDPRVVEAFVPMEAAEVVVAWADPKVVEVFVPMEAAEVVVAKADPKVEAVARADPMDFVEVVVPTVFPLEEDEEVVVVAMDYEATVVEVLVVGAAD